MFTCWLDGVTNDFSSVTISWLASFQGQTDKLLFILQAEYQSVKSPQWLISFCQSMTWTLQLREQRNQRQSDNP